MPQSSNQRLLLKGGGDMEWASSTQSLCADGKSDHDDDRLDRVISLAQPSTSMVSSLDNSTRSLLTDAQHAPPPPTKSIGSSRDEQLHPKEEKFECDNDRVGPHRLPVPLRLTADDEQLTPYECLIRKNLEFFEAERSDVQNFGSTIRPGQVGLRCRHCAHRPSIQAMFPRTYQEAVVAAEILATRHLNQCSFVSEHITEELQRTEKEKDFHYQYWKEAAKQSGVAEGPGYLAWSRTESCLERRAMPLEFKHFKVTAETLASINKFPDGGDFCSTEFGNEEPSEPQENTIVIA